MNNKDCKRQFLVCFVFFFAFKDEIISVADSVFTVGDLRCFLRPPRARLVSAKAWPRFKPPPLPPRREVPFADARRLLDGREPFRTVMKWSVTKKKKKMLLFLATVSIPVFWINDLLVVVTSEKRGFRMNLHLDKGPCFVYQAVMDPDGSAIFIFSCFPESSFLIQSWRVFFFSIGRLEPVCPVWKQGSGNSCATVWFFSRHSEETEAAQSGRMYIILCYFWKESASCLFI